jgi:uncharacterized protein YcgI (DUF1989 family)
MGETELITIPAGHGKACRLAKGQSVKLINTPGTQVVDTWAFAAEDLSEFVSMEISRRMALRIMLRAGDMLYTNRREPLLAFAEDTSPGVHDALITCCDRYTYETMGCTEFHRNCADNLVEGLEELGLAAPRVPNPLNLFMNIPVSNNQDIAIEAPVSKPGDYVVLQAERDSIVAFSACPMDLMPINGPDQTPKDAHFQVLG